MSFSYDSGLRPASVIISFKEAVIAILRFLRALQIGCKNKAASFLFDEGMPCTVMYAMPLESGLFSFTSAKRVCLKLTRTSKPVTTPMPKKPQASVISSAADTESWSTEPATARPASRAFKAAIAGV